VSQEYYRVLALDPFKGSIDPEYENSEFLEAISECGEFLDKPSSRILLDSRNRVGVVSLPISENKTRDIVIKEFRTKGIDKLKSAIISSKASKAWKGGMALFKEGLGTPRPIAYLEKKEGLFLEESFYLSEWVNNAEEIRILFRKLTSDELNRLVKELSKYLSICHKKGILHRDLSDGNILVKKDSADKYLFYTIDSNRIRLKRKIGILSRIKSLIRLGIPADFQRFFLEQYLGTSRIRKGLWLWYKINKSKYTFYNEIKNKLRLRQITQKLKIQ